CSPRTRRRGKCFMMSAATAGTSSRSKRGTCKSSGLSDTTASKPSEEIGISPTCSRMITIFGYPSCFHPSAMIKSYEPSKKRSRMSSTLSRSDASANMAILPFERITTLLAPACLWRQLSLPSVSRSNPCPACLTVAILYPARTSSGITRSMNVVLPLLDFPTKQTIGTAIETFLSAARQPVRAGLTRLGLIRPGFAIEQLDGHQIARVEALHVGRYINQTVRLDHGGENTGALIPRGAHLERAVLLCQHPSKKMPAIRPF